MADQKYRILHDGVADRRRDDIVMYPAGIDTARLVSLGAIEPLYGPDAEQDAAYDDSLATTLRAREVAGDHSHDGREIEQRKMQAERELNELLKAKAAAELDAARAQTRSLSAPSDSTPIDPTAVATPDDAMTETGADAEGKPRRK